MRKFAIGLIGSLVLLIAISTSALPPSNSTPVSPAGSAILHDTAYIQSGELLMFVNNRGSFAYDKTAFSGKNDGLHYPGECPWAVIYAAGLWLGAKVDGEVRVSASEYEFDYTPGPITGGLPYPDSPQYRVYKIHSGDSPLSNTDYAEWPFEQGAPALKNAIGQDSLDAQGNRIPLLLGDEAIWTAFNDADMAVHESDPGSGSAGPLGLEIWLYAYAFDSAGPLGRTIFLDYTLINKGGNTLDSMFIALWSDPDLGDPGDDLVGCDTLKDLGYCYNETNNDAEYGANPPVVGIKLLNGPMVPSPDSNAWKSSVRFPIPGYRNLHMTSFAKYVNGTDPSDNIEAWNYLRGKKSDGSDEIDPVTGQPTTFVMSGDPVIPTGWIDTRASDRRLMLSSGPITILPGDTQEVATAVMVGTNHPFDCYIEFLADTLYAVHTAGSSSASAFALIAEPDSTIGHDYEMSFTGPVHDIRWHLQDLSTGEFLLSDQSSIDGRGDQAIIDGLVVKVLGPPPGVGSWEVAGGTRRLSWIGGNGLNLEGFNGAIGWDDPCHIFGVCEERAVPIHRLRRVLLKHAKTVEGSGYFLLSDPNVSYAYRYLEHADSPPAYEQFGMFITNQSEDFAFQGFKKSVPLSAWDIDSNPPRRLAIGHLENNAPNGMVNGKYYPHVLNSRDNTVDSGPREWLFILDLEYAESIDSSLTVGLLSGSLPIMYTITANLRSTLGWESGDEFLILPSDTTTLLTIADRYLLSSPPARSAQSNVNTSRINAGAYSDLLHTSQVVQAKFAETHWDCACPCLADPVCAGGTESVVNVLDVVGFIDVAFRGVPAVSDRPCPTERTDVNCDHVTDIRDVVSAIDVAFRGADPALRFCNPCNQP